MKTIVAMPGAPIEIGRTGENKAVKVVFQSILDKWKELYGEGLVSMVYKRPRDRHAYPVVCLIENNGADVSWVVSRADLKNSGLGKLELAYTVNETVAISETYPVMIKRSISGESGSEPPEDPGKTWFEDMNDRVDSLEKREMIVTLSQVYDENGRGTWQANHTFEEIKNACIDPQTLVSVQALAHNPKTGVIQDRQNGNAIYFSSRNMIEFTWVYPPSSSGNFPVTGFKMHPDESITLVAAMLELSSYKDTNRIGDPTSTTRYPSNKAMTNYVNSQILAGKEIFMVNWTESPEVCQADKTYTEIKAALENDVVTVVGKTKNDGKTYATHEITIATDGKIYFRFVWYDETRGTMEKYFWLQEDGYGNSIPLQPVSHQDWIVIFNSFNGHSYEDIVPLIKAGKMPFIEDNHDLYTLVNYTDNSVTFRKTSYSSSSDNMIEIADADSNPETNGWQMSVRHSGYPEYIAIARSTSDGSFELDRPYSSMVENLNTPRGEDSAMFIRTYANDMWWRFLYYDAANNIIVFGGAKGARTLSILTVNQHDTVSITEMPILSPSARTDDQTQEVGADTATGKLWATPSVFYVDLTGDYPNYTCTTAMADIAAAYAAGRELKCRCIVGSYSNIAVLPLFMPIPEINTWVFSGSGALAAMETPAQSFTVAIANDEVLAEITKLATMDDIPINLPNPYALTIKTNNKTVIYDGIEAKTVEITGGNVSMRVDGDYIQYSTNNGTNWVNLIALAELKGTPGKNGADGITPHIGDNGNWYIGNSDTGKSSRGATGAKGLDGVDGKTPVRGTDYWTDADKQEIINSVIAALPDGTEVSY